jgi:hypothetical protein
MEAYGQSSAWSETIAEHDNFSCYGHNSLEL